jgi:hypothetical protein
VTPDPTDSRFRKAVLVSAAVVGLAIVICLVVLASISTRTGCEEGHPLEKARLLNAAARAYDQDGGACGKQGVTRVAGEQRTATSKFQLGVVYDGRLKSVSPSRLVAVIDGLRRDPFHVPAVKALNAALVALQASNDVTGAERCLINARLLNQAQIPLHQAGEKHLRWTCRAVVERLAKIRGFARSQLHDGDLLAASGDDDRAANRYASALYDDPSLRRARSTLLERSRLDDHAIDAVGDWLAGIWPTIRSGLRWLVPLAIALLLLALLGFKLAQAGSLKWSGFRQRLADAGNRWPLRWMRNAAVLRLEVAGFEGDVEGGPRGADVSALLGTAISQSCGRARSFSVDRVSGPTPASQTVTSAAELLSGIPQAQVVGSILKALAPLLQGRYSQVSGRLLPAGERGAGLSVTVSPASGAIESNTVWESFIDPVPGGTGPEPWFRLVNPAAAWVRWQLAPRIADGAAEGDWRAEALFEAGAQWWASHDPTRAGVLYARAIQFDPDYLPAIHNLAVVEIWEGSYQAAVDRLSGVVERVVSDAEARDRWPDLEITALYNLARAQCYLTGAAP